MESQNTDEKDQFVHDVPFHDSPDQSDASTSALSSNLRHRIGSSSKEPAGDSLVETQRKTSSRTYKSHKDSNPNDDTSEITESNRDKHDSTHVESTATTAKNNEPVTQTRNSADSITELTNSTYPSWSLLMFISRLVLRPIWFLLKLIIKCITFFPISMLGYCIMFVIDPFKTVRQLIAYGITKLIRLWIHSIFGRVISIFGWGMCWVVYVGFVLCGLLLISFVISGFLMKYMVEQPLVIKETLNLDYTKSSPVAFVPIISCAAVGSGVKCMEKKNLGSRIIPPYHELQVSVSLTLPESDYNMNLGMFQVRTDFISVNGETLASSSHPCMMRFKSFPIRLLHTLFTFAPLVTGYVSEVQTLNVNIRGLNQGTVPTSCLKVVLEQRASYGPGAGIPELYGASLILESELPFIKRIIWYWKKTVFMWVSIMSFAMELLFVLVCCRCVLVPRTRKIDGSANSRSM